MNTDTTLSLVRSHILVTGIALIAAIFLGQIVPLSLLGVLCGAGYSLVSIVFYAAVVDRIGDRTFSPLRLLLSSVLKVVLLLVFFFSLHALSQEFLWSALAGLLTIVPSSVVWQAWYGKETKMS